MVTHPSTNRAQRRVTSFMRWTTLPLWPPPTSESTAQGRASGWRSAFILNESSATLFYILWPFLHSNVGFLCVVKTSIRELTWKEHCALSIMRLVVDEEMFSCSMIVGCQVAEDGRWSVKSQFHWSTRFCSRTVGGGGHAEKLADLGLVGTRKFLTDRISNWGPYPDLDFRPWPSVPWEPCYDKYTGKRSRSEFTWFKVRVETERQRRLRYLPWWRGHKNGC